MKKLLLILGLIGISLIAQAQTRVDSKMVKIDTNGMTRLTNIVTLQQALIILDPAPVDTDYSPRSTTNTTITLVTPRWIGDLEVIYHTGGTNVQVWQSYGVTTSTWVMIYPSQVQSTTNSLSTNVAPVVAGQMLQINGATNILWRAFADTNSTLSWKATYRGPP